MVNLYESMGTGRDQTCDTWFLPTGLWGPVYIDAKMVKFCVICVLQYPGHKAEKESDIPGLLRIKMWLGLNQQEEEWHKMQKEGDMAVFAETVNTSFFAYVT